MGRTLAETTLVFFLLALLGSGGPGSHAEEGALSSEEPKETPLPTGLATETRTSLDEPAPPPKREKASPLASVPETPEARETKPKPRPPSNAHSGEASPPKPFVSSGLNDDPRDAADAVQSEARPWWKPGVELRAGGVAAVGLGTEPSMGYAGSIGVSWKHVSIAVEGSNLVPTPWTERREIALRSVAVVPCLRWQALEGCGLLKWGELRIEGPGLPEGGLTSPRPEAGARVGARVDLWGPFGVQVAADVLFPLGGTEARHKGEAVWETPGVTGTLGAGIVAAL